jgi:hypothetical protein
MCSPTIWPDIYTDIKQHFFLYEQGHYEHRLLGLEIQFPNSIGEAIC